MALFFSTFLLCHKTSLSRCFLGRLRSPILEVLSASETQPIQGPMPSSSSSLREYEIFLSFRGEDTRKNFVSHLYDALVRKGIKTFKDDKKLEKGSSISSALPKAIEESRLSIIVISADYASSRWCLDELVKIVECDKGGSLTEVPIFYEVDPSDVRHQKRSFAEVFRSHEEKSRVSLEKLRTWKEALTYVANKSGHDSKSWGDESEMIQEIVRDVSSKLFPTPLGDNTDLVGMEAHMTEMTPLLGMNFPDEVRFIGIWGMGGAGKTTLAEFLFQRHSHEFKAHCFLKDVKEICKIGDLRELKKQLLSKTLEIKDLDIGEVDDLMETRLRHLKVLVVLDDVDGSGQIEAVAKSTDWFGSGSRIIITTRNKHLLVVHKVQYRYKVHCLCNSDALQLFKLFAFKGDNADETYQLLSDRAVKYTGNLPLALKVLGSFLYTRSVDEWESAFRIFERRLDDSIMKVLRASYDSLAVEYKTIFLYVACIFRGDSKDHLTSVLDACGYAATIGIQVLAERCLLEISRSESIDMHDLLQQMGKELGKPKFLSDGMDIQSMQRNNMGMEQVEGISVNLSKMDAPFLANSNAFERMHNLKILQASYYPLSTLGFSQQPQTSGFSLECLVELDMSHSKLEKLWEGKQSLRSLRRMKLFNSWRLKTLPDLSTAIKLEILDLRCCLSLVALPDLSKLTNLEKLDLSHCGRLVALPDLSKLSNLEKLDLSYCRGLKSLPRKINSKHINLSFCDSLKKSLECSDQLLELELGGRRIKKLASNFGNFPIIVHFYLMCCRRLRTLPSSIGNMICLQSWEIWACDMLENLPISVQNLKSLKTLKVGWCPRITEFPHVPENVETLWLRGTGIKEVSSRIENLSQLNEFRIEDTGLRCTKLVNLPCQPQIPQSSFMVQVARVLGRDGYLYAGELILPCLWVTPLSDLTNLETLSLRDFKMSRIPNDIGHLRNLVKLDLGGNDFETIPASIKHLSELHSLSLKKCKKLRSLPELPDGLDSIYADGCESLEKASPAFRHNIRFSMFADCYNLQDVDLIIRHLVSTRNESGPFFAELPGREVPRHFRYQAKGPLLVVELPRVRLASEIIRFIACVVTTAERSYLGTFNCCCQLRSKDRVLEFENLDVSNDGDIMPYCISNHMTVFSNRKGLKKYNKYTDMSAVHGDFSFDEVSFQFSLCQKWNASWPVNFKECGVHLVFAEDMEDACEDIGIPS